MRIWISNTRSNQAYERKFFALVRDSLILRKGSANVAEEFPSLVALALLPWLDQPRFLDPARLTSEIYGAWDELWTVPATELSLGSGVAAATSASVRSLNRGSGDVQTLGFYLARPLHGLAVFAASGGKGAQLRAGTHRELIVEPSRLAWRVIRGGAAR